MKLINLLILPLKKFVIIFKMKMEGLVFSSLKVEEELD